MNLLARWWRFNLVGILGFTLQMASLAILHRCLLGHDLLVTAAAVEITLLHNFLWHLRYTWRDRQTASPLPQLVRFHLSNGLVSLAGNLLIVHRLRSHTRLPLLAANTIAVLCCAVANFYLGNVWAFAPPQPQKIELVGPPGLEPGTNGL